MVTIKSHLKIIKSDKNRFKDLKMTILFQLLIIFLFINPLNAKNVSCEFEEVYQNGETHQGFFLLNNDQIRYEYYNDNLYTLLYLNEKMYVANNS